MTPKRLSRAACRSCPANMREALLRDADYEVATFLSSFEAIEGARDGHNGDLLIVRLQMPTGISLMLVCTRLGDR